MKKILTLCRSYFEPLLIITVLIMAMIGQSLLNMFILWGSFSLLVGIALWRLRKPEAYYSIIKDKAFLFFCIFILWSIISCLFWTQAGINSFLILFIFLTGLLSYFLGYTENFTKAQNCQKLLLALGLALVFLTYYQFFALGMKRPIGLLLNWNTHAGFLSLVLLPWILRFILGRQASTIQLLLLCATTLLFSFALGLTQSRGALLLMAVAIFCIAIFAWCQRTHPSYKNSFVLLGSIFLGYLYSGLFVSATIFQRIGTVTDIQSYTATGSGRHLLWKPAWQMFLDRPFTGWGLGSYSSLFAQYKAPLTDEVGNYAHNDYLQFLLELGPVGLLIFLIFVFFIVRKYFYLLQKNTDDITDNKTEAVILLASCLGMLVHTFFTFHLYHASMLILFSYYLGLSAKKIHLAQSVWVENSNIQITGRLIWLYRTFSVVMLIFICIYGYATYHIAQADKTTTLTEKIFNYQQATLFISALDKEEAVSSHYFTLLLEKEKNQDERKKIAIHTLTIVNIAIEKMPLFKWNYITKANLLIALQTNYIEVCEQYAQALKLDPYLLDYRYEYAKLLSENGQHKQALEMLWAGWGLLYHLPYQKGITYLYYQLQMIYMYGNTEYITVIEQQIEKLKQKKRYRTLGKYILEK